MQQDWATFCSRLLASSGQSGAASASAELKALHNTCTTLYAFSDPNGPGGLMEMALQGWQNLERSLSVNEVEAWGAVQHSLGLAYQDRVAGEDADKHRRAIWHFNHSLSVYDRARFPTQWAKTHHKLAISLLALERAGATGSSIRHLDEQRRVALVAYVISVASTPSAGSILSARAAPLPAESPSPIATLSAPRLVSDRSPVALRLAP